MSDTSSSSSGGGAKLSGYKNGAFVLPGFGSMRLLGTGDICRPGCPPPIFVGSSKAGKTVAAVDMVLTNASKATFVMFVTDSYNSGENTYLQNMIVPWVVKRYDFDMLCKVWADIMLRSVNYARYTSYGVASRFIQGHCANDPRYSGQIDELKGAMRDGAQMFQSQQDALDAYKTREHAIMLKYIAEHFDEGAQGLTAEERMVIQYCQATRPYPVLVIDDVTASLVPPSGKVAVPKLNEAESDIVYEEMSGAKAFDSLLLSILTRMRHYGGGALFVHSTKNLPAGLRQQASAFIFMSDSAMEEACRQAVISPDDKEPLRAAMAEADKYTYMKVIYTPDPGNTAHGQKFAFYKATYHRDPPAVFGCPTYAVAMQDIKLRIDDYLAGKVARSQSSAMEQQMSAKLDQLAKEGSTVPTGPQSFLAGMTGGSTLPPMPPPPSFPSLPSLPSFPSQYDGRRQQSDTFIIETPAVPLPYITPEELNKKAFTRERGSLLD